MPILLRPQRILAETRASRRGIASRDALVRTGDAPPAAIAPPAGSVTDPEYLAIAAVTHMSYEDYLKAKAKIAEEAKATNVPVGTPSAPGPIVIQAPSPVLSTGGVVAIVVGTIVIIGGLIYFWRFR